MCLRVSALTVAAEGHSNSQLHVTAGFTHRGTARGFPVGTQVEIPGWRWEKGKWERLFKPWSCYTAWPGQRLKTTVDHGLELEGSPLPQAGNGLPNIWKLAF